MIFLVLFHFLKSQCQIGVREILSGQWTLSTRKNSRKILANLLLRNLFYSGINLDMKVVVSKI